MLANENGTWMLKIKKERKKDVEEEEGKWTDKIWTEMRTHNRIIIRFGYNLTIDVGLHNGHGAHFTACNMPNNQCAYH